MPAVLSPHFHRRAADDADDVAADDDGKRRRRISSRKRSYRRRHFEDGTQRYNRSAGAILDHYCSSSLPGWTRRFDDFLSRPRCPRPPAVRPTYRYERPTPLMFRRLPALSSRADNRRMSRRQKATFTISVASSPSIRRFLLVACRQKAPMHAAKRDLMISRSKFCLSTSSLEQEWSFHIRFSMPCFQVNNL